MPYKDPDKQAKFQNEWLKKRRSEWIAANGPCKKCGSDERLTVVKNHHTVKTVKVWSWSDAGRAKVLKKCIVLCRKCSIAHYSEQFRKDLLGKPGTATKLTAEIVWMVRGRLLGRESARQIAESMDIDHRHILAIQTGRAWGWLKGGRRKVYGIKKVRT